MTGAPQKLKDINDDLQSQSGQSLILCRKFVSGANGRIRTDDLLFTKQLLYH